MTESPFRVGLIGYGLAGACFHAPFVAATPGLWLAAVVTRDKNRQADVRRDHPDARILEAADQLWHSARSFDLVVIASPNRTHVEFARAALDAGLAVVVDKPLAPTSAQARALIAHARERRRMLTVYQNRRWDGDFRTVQHIVASGELGQPFRFESRFERWRPNPTRGWRHLATAEDAGGLLFDLGSHLIDQARLLFGPVSQVYAELDRRHPQAEVDDDTFVALTHRSGVRSHLFMSSMAAQSGPRFRVLGSKAGFVKYGMDVQEDALKAGARPPRPDWGADLTERWGRLGYGDSFRVVPTLRGSYQLFYEGVVRALRNEAPAPVDPDDALATLELIEAAHVSSREQRVVEIR